MLWLQFDDIFCSIPELWGEDADVWDPTRFLNGEDDKEVKIGVYANV